MSGSSYAKPIGVIALMLVAGGALWALAREEDEAQPRVAIPKELTVDALRNQVEDRGQMRRTMREAMEREDLTEEQRRQVRDNFRDIWQSEMQKRMDEYFNASEAEQEAILDRQIDEFQEMRKRWERQRGERDTQRGEQTEEQRQTRREAWRRRRANMTSQERKARSESRSPDQRAQRFKYFAAMRKRMSDRGIEPPRWGSRGRGAAGGSRGGRGG